MPLGKIDQYFMTSDAPNGRVQRFDLKKARTALIGLGLFLLLVILALPNGNEKQAPAAVSATDKISATTGSAYNDSAKNGDFYLSTAASAGSQGYGALNGRQRSASQIVKSDGDGSILGLPSGSSISAAILNRIVTSEPRSPVVAVVTGTTSGTSGIDIPVGTKVLGIAEASSGSDRVQINFHTMVYENGQEVPVKAVAVMPDGSNGIAGEFHSQMLEKESGRFLSHFAAGFANGYKDREAGGVFPLEPGNLKNAALGGISESASEQAKAYGEQLKSVRPFVSVEPGTKFLIFFAKG